MGTSRTLRGRLGSPFRPCHSALSRRPWFSYRCAARRRRCAQRHVLSLPSLASLMALEWWQWLIAGLAALIVGCAKTGLPGLGLVAVPLMAVAFGGRASVGTLLPMLIIADCFAVLFYRRHARWDHLLRLLPSVCLGLPLGFILMWWLGLREVAAGEPDAVFTSIIGMVILVMVALLCLRRWWGDRLVPRGRLSVVLYGSGAGIATFLANAAGPMMALYLAGMRAKKEAFMGTNAWFFLLLNLSKVPLFLILGLLVPQAPLITGSSLRLNVILAPAIIVGVLLGAWLFTRLNQRLFDALVLILAAAAAVHLIVGG
ncbi:MAG: sulfite exporter TauE/SafE family protein [Planctomycetota bacterium]|nr:MAG: sulfite exporter TauE/SafE family protein [Planctomycetota bacterium]